MRIHLRLYPSSYVLNSRTLPVVLYVFALGYLAGPVVGVPVDTAHVVDLVTSLPDWFKYATKGAVGMAFSFHSWNGIRHLLWDAGRCECVARLVFVKLFTFPSDEQPGRQEVWLGSCGN